MPIKNKSVPYLKASQRLNVPYAKHLQSKRTEGIRQRVVHVLKSCLEESVEPGL